MVTYVISQIMVAINYLLMIASYQLKDHNKILVYNLLSLLAAGMSYFLLSAYAGIAMTLIGIIRNLILFVHEKKGNKTNIIELIILFILSGILLSFTYDGPLSLMTFVATMTYTVSIWQKNTKVYKILGIPISIAGITYNVYIKSILGAAFESVSLMSAIIGFIREIFGKRKDA